MTRNERALLSGFIDELLDRFSADGCNDYCLPDTEENRELAVAARHALDGEHFQGLHISGGQIHLSNSSVLYELQRRFLKV